MDLTINNCLGVCDCFDEIAKLLIERRTDSVNVRVASEYCQRDGEEWVNYIAKIVGLIITDGPLSRILSLKNLKSITFRGLSRDTAYAVFCSSVKISNNIKISISKQNTLRLNKPYFNVSLKVNEDVGRRVLDTLGKFIHDPSFTTTLSDGFFAALLAGIIDGDGYVGLSKRHAVISYDRSSLKGGVIDKFLKQLSSKGFSI